MFSHGTGPDLRRRRHPPMARLYGKERPSRFGRSRFPDRDHGACAMKFVELPPLVRDLLERRGRSILDPWPAIERLDRELEMVEILEEPAQEDGRVFPIVTKVY